MAVAVKDRPMAPRRKLSVRARKEMIIALLFVSPWVIGFLTFIAYPAIASLYYSMTEFNIVKSPTWVGVDNYVQLFTDDRYFGQAMFNTVYMVVVGVPFSLVLAFICAMLLNMDFRGKALYRTIYYLPTVVPPVATTLLWMWILNPDAGILANLFKMVGLRGPGWFSDPVWSKPAIIFMGLWGIGNSSVLYLAALQGVPKELYEAATLDGANWLQRMLRITIPLVSPVTLFMIITGIIGAFQIFTPSYIYSESTQGSPQGSLLFYCLYLFGNAFNYMKMGYASALAWILFLLILVVTAAMIKTSGSWTHYDI